MNAAWINLQLDAQQALGQLASSQCWLSAKVPGGRRLD
jgi:hypothetical protein